MKQLPLSSLGEFGLINRIRKKVAPQKNAAPIVVGLGDDAFVGKITPGSLLVTTKDMLVERVHFRREWTSPEELGYKSVAVNLSDLAAMGRCRPLYGLVGLALPADIPVDFVDKLYTGVNKISRAYGLSIVGGDTVSSKKDIVISITLIGEIKKEFLLTRSGAQVGDILFVTGTLGDSSGGLHLLQKGAGLSSPWARFLVKKHRMPEPRFDAALPLSATRRVHSMMDCSDGLAASAALISKASGVGIRIDMEKLPVSKALRRLGQNDASVDPAHMAVTGGEEYELVFTAPPQALPALRNACPDITPVGIITPGKKVEFYYHGKSQKIDVAGFRHF